MAADREDRYSNDAQRVNLDFYNHFKWRKNPLIFVVYAKIFQRFKGLHLSIIHDLHTTLTTPPPPPHSIQDIMPMLFNCRLF